MSELFIDLVRRKLSPLFNEHGFRFKTEINSDGGNECYLVYESKESKILLYNSARNGEINCMIGDSDADPTKPESGKWKYLNSLVQVDSQKTIDELISEVPLQILDDESQISQIQKNLRVYFYPTSRGN